MHKHVYCKQCSKQRIEKIWPFGRKKEEEMWKLYTRKLAAITQDILQARTAYEVSPPDEQGFLEISFDADAFFKSRLLHHPAFRKDFVIQSIDNEDIRVKVRLARSPAVFEDNDEEDDD